MKKIYFLILRLVVSKTHFYLGYNKTKVAIDVRGTKGALTDMIAKAMAQNEDIKQLIVYAVAKYNAGK
jgi:hypothetical protein